jgi:hypothetical protein
MVLGVEQQRHEAPADGARSSGQENLHDVSSLESPAPKAGWLFFEIAIPL